MLPFTVSLSQETGISLKRGTGLTILILLPTTYSPVRKASHKSFTSTLIGIAIKEGFIDNVSQKVLDFFSEMTIENVDA